MDILIVEPRPERQRQLRTILSSLGHRTTSIDSVVDFTRAMTALRKKKYDICFLALNPPQTSATTFLKEIRMSSVNKNLAVVVIIGPGAKKEDITTLIQVGATSFLAYPFSACNVEDAIKKALEERDLS